MYIVCRVCVEYIKEATAKQAGGRARRCRCLPMVVVFVAVAAVLS